MSEVALEVVELHRGPDDGQRAEVPVGQGEIWRWVHGVGYCLYGRRRRSAKHMTFRRKIIPTVEEMADYVRRNYDLDDPAQQPWLHIEAETPHARKVRTEPIE